MGPHGSAWILDICFGLSMACMVHACTTCFSCHVAVLLAGNVYYV